ncbi:MAG TPA: glycine cleavage system protein H, partial [Candidatus Atribacteria bacterium]|nr:glycine cleavage system protein H [Candidatus Atribacteria bacterium]
PVSGRVVEVNAELTSNPERVNEDPYGSWMVVMEIADHAELDDLMSPEDYKAYCGQEE